MTTSSSTSISEFISNASDENEIYFPFSVEVIDQEILSSRDACIVKLFAKVEDDVIVVTGTSRRNPCDRHDPRIGEMLAYTRAFSALTKRLSRRAEGISKHRDDIIRTKPEQKAKSERYRSMMTTIASSDQNVHRLAVTRLRQQEGNFPSAIGNPNCV